MIKSKKHLASLLNTSWAKLELLCSNIDKYYYIAKKVDLDDDGNPIIGKDGKPKIRILNPSVGELKDIQNLINVRILRTIKISDVAYGGVKGKDNVKNSKRHLGKKFKFVTDLKKCFPNINSGMVYKALIKNNFSPDTAGMLTKLTTYKNQLPQGAKTSTYICNIVMQTLDFKMEAICEPLGITYTRFVDDLTFSSQTDFKEITLSMIDVIVSEGHKVSHKKTSYAIGSTMITGNRVNNNYQTISDKLKNKIIHPEKYTPKQIKGQLQYASRVMD